MEKEQPIRRGYDISNTDQNPPETLEKWKRGETGFPLVDAGMRQLIIEGFIPRQVRLVSSACLVEGLNVPWKFGMKNILWTLTLSSILKCG